MGDEVHAARVRWLRRWIPAATDLRDLTRVRVNIGYCDTCTEHEPAVHGEWTADGQTWGPFTVFADEESWFPGYEDLPEPDDPYWDPTAGGGWRTTHG